MAETSGRWTTDGTTPVGDQVASYDQTWDSQINQILAACAGFEGVAPGYLNGLAGTVGGANTVAINTGGAVVDSKIYLNNASLNVNIPSAVGGGNTRIDRIALLADWSGFACRVVRVAGTDAVSPTAPALVTTSGTTYEIPLYQALVDTGGTVTLTDERRFAGGAPMRQGGSATAWATAGTTNYTALRSMMQAGTVQTANPTGIATITFPVAFAYAPLVFVQPYNNGGDLSMAIVRTISATQAEIYTWVDNGGIAHGQCTVYWMAIGPVA